MHKSPRLSLLAVPVLLIAACGGGGASPSAATSAAPSVAAPSSAPASEAPSESASPSASASEAASASASAAASASAGGANSIELADSSLGSILVDSGGLTLYGFKADTEGESTCYDQCAENWPPLLADGDVTVGEGVDESLVTTVERTDGTMQAKYGDWPLYYFANDAAPGDTNGQGLNDVWYVVGADGALIE